MKKTKRISVAVASAAALLFMSTAASALPTVNMLWRQPPGNSPTAAGAGVILQTPTIGVGSTVIADIVLTADGSPGIVTGVFVSIAFDATELTGVGGRELASVNLPGMGNTFAPVGVGVSGGGTSGLFTNFDTGTLATGLTTGTRTLGSVKFTVTAITADSDPDVIANLDNAGTDTIATNVGSSGATFGGAYIGDNSPVVPEPTTALLLGAGLLGLGFAGRRNLR